ncbi:MAG: M48 family metalloprotease [Planctomycetes bacterium]|nr:M48 family metalloprotease [Planctomycetota bacterium]
MTNTAKDQTPKLCKKYSAQKNMSMISSASVSLLYLVFMLLLGSDILKYYIVLITSNQYILIAIYLFTFFLLLELFTMPLQFYSGFVLDHLFKLSNQSFLGWVKDESKKFFMSVMLLLFLGEVMYLLLRSFPGFWWVFTSIVWVFISIIIAKLAPVLIFPLFYKIVPIESEDIKKRLLDLAEGTGMDIEGVYRINLSKKTKKANAALAGLGSTRRVLLGDTLLDSYSLDEIASVFAHELGHHVYRHIWKQFAIGVVSTFMGFAVSHYIVTKALAFLGYQAIHDIAVFPLLCLVFAIFALILLPIQNACSRRWERACDKYAIKKTNNPRSFISLMDKLADQNLADRVPNRLIELIFYDHPPIAKRIEMAKELSLTVNGYPETNL